MTLKSLIHQERKLIVRLRMWYAKIRGHKGKRWDYEPSEHYMGWHKHDKHDTLVEQLGKLTVVEAGELSKKLEEVWGLDLSVLTSAPVEAPVVEEVKTTATVVVLTAFADGKKIPVLQKIRKYKDMGLMEAKNFVEDLPQTVSEDILIEDAETMKQQLEEVGGTVELK